MFDSTENQRNQMAFVWLQRFCNDHAVIDGTLTEHEFDDQSPLSAWQSAESIIGVDAVTLTAMIAKHYDLDTVKIKVNMNEELLHYVPRKFAQQYTIFPLDLSDGQLTVASPHPFDRDMESMLEFLTTFHVKTRLASPEIINEWIEKYYHNDLDSKKDIVIKSSLDSNKKNHQSTDSAIVKIVSEMFLEAFLMKASDIHIEPYQNGGIVRYRIDGMLRVISEVPAPILVPIIQRIKAIARLNLAKKMIPQDGSVSLEMRGHDVDLRVSTLPVQGGEKVVIRLLIKSVVNSIEEIGLQSKELESLKRLLLNSEGIFVITGPTGSGKTSTLYAALKELNAPEKCLVTVEDPVEYEIDGIAQVSINPAQNLTFSAALKSILRQDPDVILMGEIRDEETADMTFRAAITGHFVMTTLHTSDAITTIPRLMGLGVPPPIVADTLKGVAAQRLVRKLCSSCSTVGPLANDTQGQRFNTVFPKLQIKSAVGCEKCKQTGYKGRMPLFEIITMTHQLADAIRAGEDTSTLRKIAAKTGSRTLYEVAIEAICNGHTSAEEVNRVLGEAFWQALH
ncbi:GspE/PulE family protein [Pseudoalteromonas sp. GB56]